MQKPGSHLNRITLEVFGSRIIISPPVMLGFSLDWTWVYIVMFGEKLMFDLYDVNPSALHIFMVGDMAFAAAAAFALHRFLSGLHRQKRTSLALAVGVAGRLLCIVCLVFANVLKSVEAQTVICLLAGFLGGMGSGILLILWGKCFWLEQAPSAASNISASYVLAFAVSYALSKLFSSFGLVVVVSLIPPIEGLLLSRVFSCSQSALDEPPAPRSPSLIRSPVLSDLVATLAKLAVAALVLGYLLSVMRELSVTSLLLGEQSVAEICLVIGATLVVGVLINVALFYNGGNDAGLRFPLAAVSLSVAVMLVIDGGEIPYRIVSLCAYFVLEMSAWTTLVNYARKKGSNRDAVFGCGAALLFVGQLIVPLHNEFSVLLTDGMPVLEQVTDPASMVLLLFLVLYLVSTGDMMQDDVERPAGMNESASRFEDGDRLRVARLNDIASLYQLSPRETEIMRLIAEGRSALGMSERLGISENTAKTYMRRLYSKVDVHSRQELLALIDTFDSQGAQYRTSV